MKGYSNHDTWAGLGAGLGIWSIQILRRFYCVAVSLYELHIILE